jgi:hypothetical protein
MMKDLINLAFSLLLSLIHIIVSFHFFVIVNSGHTLYYLLL